MSLLQGKISRLDNRVLVENSDTGSGLDFSCGGPVLVEQSAQTLSASDPVDPGTERDYVRFVFGSTQTHSSALVAAPGVVMGDVNVEHVAQVPFSGDEDPVGALSADGADSSARRRRYPASSTTPDPQIADSARTGAATVILSGISVGLESAVYSALLIGAAVYGAFLLGGRSWSKTASTAARARRRTRRRLSATPSVTRSRTPPTRRSIR